MVGAHVGPGTVGVVVSPVLGASGADAGPDRLTVGPAARVPPSTGPRVGRGRPQVGRRGGGRRRCGRGRWTRAAPRRPDPVHERLAALAPAASGWVPAPPSDDVADALAVGPPPRRAGAGTAPPATAPRAPGAGAGPVDAARRTLAGRRPGRGGRGARARRPGRRAGAAGLGARRTAPPSCPRRTTVRDHAPVARPDRRGVPRTRRPAAGARGGRRAGGARRRAGRHARAGARAGRLAGRRRARRGRRGHRRGRPGQGQPRASGGRRRAAAGAAARRGGRGAVGRCRRERRGRRARRAAGSTSTRPTSSALDALDGIGPVLAQRILDWRQEHGRFTSVEELGEVTGIGDALLARLRETVTV